MSIYLFGYGSLMSAESAGRALKRNLSTAELVPTFLNGYVRTWSLKERVYAEALDREVTALFLDLERAPEVCCNGVLLEVSEESFENLRRREKNYDHLDVTGAVTTMRAKQQARVYTFVAKPEFKVLGGEGELFVMDRYVAMIETACATLGADFERDYAASTRPIRHPRLESGYVFVDPEQAKHV